MAIYCALHDTIASELGTCVSLKIYVSLQAHLYASLQFLNCLYYLYICSAISILILLSLNLFCSLYLDTTISMLIVLSLC